MNIKRLALALVVTLFVLSASAHAHAQSVFTPGNGTLIGPAGYQAGLEPTTYYPITGTGLDGATRWLEYNTSTGSVTVIKFGGPNDGEEVEFSATGLSVTITPVLSYTVYYQGYPTYGRYPTTYTYQEMKGTFNGGTLDLIFETVKTWRPFGRAGVLLPYYDVSVVSQAMNQAGQIVEGYGPSLVNY